MTDIEPNDHASLFWDRELIDAHVHLKAALQRGDLRGKNLACWCPIDHPCHADVLLALADKSTGEERT